MRRLGISIGDPAGIGPEIILKAAHRLPPGVELAIYGPKALFEEQAAELRIELAEDRLRWIPCAETQSGLQDIRRESSNSSGRSLLSGRMQKESLERAVQGVISGEVNALVTAPITKSAIVGAGFAYAGHTEYLAFRAGGCRSAMMLAGPSLRVVPLTTHIPLAAVPAALRRAPIAETLTLLLRALKVDFGVAAPRVAVAGLNPHAGEAGLFGGEEQEILVPAIAAAREAKLGEVIGPLPADALFCNLDSLGIDAVVCAYHDQALIPLKIMHRDDGVNVTLGLPFVRTSPAHGSARDIAGRRRARPQSMIAAITIATEIVERRERAARAEPQRD